MTGSEKGSSNRSSNKMNLLYRTAVKFVIVGAIGAALAIGTSALVTQYRLNFAHLNLASVQASASNAAIAQTNPQDSAKEPESLPVIDVHTHTVFSGKPERYSKIADTEEEYLSEMKEAGVIGAVSHLSRDVDNYHAELKEHGVVQCFGVAQKIDLKKLESGLRTKKYGCIKIYLGYIYRYPNDKAHHPVYRLAEKYNVPVVFHTGDTYSIKGKLKYSDPLGIDEVAVDFPKVTFVIAHIGNPWWHSAAEVAYKNPNVYVEASALWIGDLKKEASPTLIQYVQDPIRFVFGYLQDPSKMMYGTDWPLVRMKDYLDQYKAAIPREHWCAVFFDNAVRVFHMDDLKAKYHCHVNP